MDRKAIVENKAWYMYTLQGCMTFENSPESGESIYILIVVHDNITLCNYNAVIRVTSKLLITVVKWCCNLRRSIVCSDCVAYIP